MLPSVELRRGELRKVRVTGRDVLLARLEDGALAATSVVCPHEAADLSRGRIFMGAIDCPRHHYLYDLRTGRNRYPQDVFPDDLAADLAPLPLYPVREHDGWIWVGQKRARALTRVQLHIDQYRKGTALIQVLGPDGKPHAGASVSVEQETHEFVFGCVVPSLSSFSAGDQQRYHRRVREMFNLVRRRDAEQRRESPTPTIDFSNCRNRMHLAEVQRELDKRCAAAAREGPGLPGLHVYVSGRTAGWSELPGQRGSELDDLRKAARRVAGLYTLCFSHPAVGAIFWRGVSDGEDGVRGAGLLRANLSPKHAYKALHKLVHVIWHTRAQGVLDALGRFRFRGFYGTYRIVAATPGIPPTVAQLHLRADRLDNTTCLTLGGPERY